MCEILLSINPEHVENIFSGNKEYEYRRTKCKRKVDKIIIYSTAPIMKVVGEAEVQEVLVASPDEIWKITKQKSGINQHFYNEYYGNRDFAVAYHLSNVLQYKEPKKLTDFGIKTAPQSFVYV